MNKISSGNIATSVVTTLFAGISLVGILFHEIWLDEAHHWLLARDSASLSELWAVSRYEGHPILWNVMLFIITRFTSDPVWMQLVHWLISVTVVFFVMRFSPLPALWNILFVFGYFILYEYTVISRNYSILVLAFLLSIHFYAMRQYLTWGIFIFILANTHLFGLVMGFWFVISSIQDAKDESLMKNKFYKAAVFIFLVGAVLSAIQIKPPGDSPFRPDIGTLLSTVTIEKLLAIQVRGFLPVPDFSNYNGWNSNYITAISKIFAGVISVVLAGLLLCIAAEKKKTAILFTGVFLSVGMIIIMLYPASVVQATRHFGIVYIAFVGCLWLARYDKPQKFPVKLSGNLSNIVITTLLIVQLLAGASMWYFDFKRPFSEAKNTIVFLRENNLEKNIIASIDGPVPSISCYLQKKTYALSSGTFESFYRWNDTRTESRIDANGLSRARAFARKSNSRLILITYHPVATELPGIVFLKEFTKGMVKVENYYVYEIIASGND